MSHFVKDAGFNQERPTTLEAYVKLILRSPKAHGLTIDQLLASRVFEGLVEIYGADKIRKLIEGAK